MTQEGMTAEEIYENLTSRGMELKKGVATVLRLQSAWKLTQNPKRWLENFRHQCHKMAKAQQVQAFKDIAKELVLDDPDAWLEEKLAEQSVREARHELAIKLMGDHAPTLNRRKLQARRGEAKQGDDSDSDSDEEGEQEDGEEWEEDLVNGEGKEVADHESIYPNLDENPSDFPIPNTGQSEVAIGGDGDGDAPSNVSNSIFVPIGETSPEPAKSTNPTKKRAPRPSVLDSAAPASKRSKGRATKAKPPATKPVSSPVQQAPTADMTPDQSRALQNLEDSTSRSEDTRTTAMDAMAAIANPAGAAPSLVLRPEEADANRAALSTLDQYHAAAQAYKEILQARTDNKPLPGSLTGLPPSAKDLENAKRRLKEVNQALMLNLD